MDDQGLAIYKRECVTTALLARELAEKLVLLACELEMKNTHFVFEPEHEKMLRDVAGGIKAYRASCSLLRTLWDR